MLALRELQTEFRRALLGDDSNALLAEFADDPFAAERFDIYRNNVLASLTTVLRDTFPVVCRLVDERFFAYAAHEFIRAHPPTRPALSEYGAAFAGFIEQFPPCRELVYLPDVARLEWLLNGAATAPEGNTVSADALAAFAPEDAGLLTFALNVHHLESRWPVDRIWRANQPDAADERIALDCGGARLEIGRHDGIVAFRSLDNANFAFRRALGARLPLGTALEQALEADPAFTPGEVLAALFRDGIVANITSSSAQEPVS